MKSLTIYPEVRNQQFANGLTVHSSLPDLSPADGGIEGFTVYSFMIRLSLDNGKSSVNLLYQDQPCHLMRKGHGSEGDPLV